MSFTICIVTDILRPSIRVRRNLPHNWINKLFSEEYQVPRTLFEAGKVTGSATYKQSKTVWNCVVLKCQFVYSVSLFVQCAEASLHMFLLVRRLSETHFSASQCCLDGLGQRIRNSRHVFILEHGDPQPYIKKNLKNELHGCVVGLTASQNVPVSHQMVWVRGAFPWDKMND